jgi:hypothetical protein
LPNPDNSKTSITEFFGDAEYPFDLVDKGWKLVGELEKTVGSVLPFFHRLRSGDIRANELRETIRLGLIGGGLPPARAFALLDLYFDRSPLTEHLPLAIAVSGAALFGAGEEPTNEVEAADGAA